MTTTVVVERRTMQETARTARDEDEKRRDTMLFDLFCTVFRLIALIIYYVCNDDVSSNVMEVIGM